MANNLRKFYTAESYKSAELMKPSVSLIDSDGSVKFDEKEIPPFKFYAAYKYRSDVYRLDYDGDATLTQNNTRPNGYDYSEMVGAAIGDGVTSIAEQAFSDCNSLTSIDIPSGVTSIGEYAFNNCISLTSIDIPNSVTNIGVWAFQYCIKLTNVVISDSVTSIGRSAFVNCASLKSVTVNATTPPTLGSSVFSGTSSSLVIYVPSESVEAYKTAQGWSTYADRIQAIP